MLKNVLKVGLFLVFSSALVAQANVSSNLNNEGNGTERWMISWGEQQAEFVRLSVDG